MALGKILNLGGIDNSPPKTAQSLGRFRVARNVMPTPENTLIPRYDNAEPAGQPSNVYCTHLLTQYNKDLLRIVSQTTGTLGIFDLNIYRNNTQIPRNVFLPSSPVDQGMDYPQGMQSYRINNTTYFLSPYTGNLLKYDGVEISQAGCQQPIFALDTADYGGSKFLRVVNHVIDFDGNEPVSEYVQTPVGISGNTIDITVAGGTPAAYQAMPGNYADTVPRVKISPSIGGDNYFVGTAAYVSATQQFNITTTDTNMNYDFKIGSYVIVAFDSFMMASMGFISATPYFGLALKVKSISPLVLDANDALLCDSNREWITQGVGFLGSTIASQITFGTRNFLSFWSSTSADGVYYFKSLVPCFPESPSVSTSGVYKTTVDVTSPTIAATTFDTFIFNIGPSLNGWYDVNSKKISPNTELLTENVPVFSMTKYQGMLLWANDNTIWFSDTSDGGWIEQTAGAANIVVGEKEQGRITSICGTSDFLFVGRERRNYYVTGNIVTGNFRVQEVSDIEVGPWCNNSAILIKDSIVFLTAAGVFQLLSGGKVVNLSQRCPKNFETYNSNSVNEDVVFKMSGTVSNIGVPSINNPWTVSGISSSYDPFRQLLMFMKREDGNPALVIHTKSGEIYEWDGMYSSTSGVYANCAVFIAGSYYLGGTDTDFNFSRAKYCVEDKTSVPIYPSQYPIKLYTSWLTAGEPSLEKELLQLKMFGRIDTTSTAGIKVRHYKDWNINTLITDAVYFPIDVTSSLNNQVQYSHKKRLNSDKCLAASVGIEVNQADVNFELESFEVEFNPIQTGMKR